MHVILNSNKDCGRPDGTQICAAEKMGVEEGEYSNQSTHTLAYLTYNTTLNSSVLFEKRASVLYHSVICIILKRLEMSVLFYQNCWK